MEKDYSSNLAYIKNPLTGEMQYVKLDVSSESNKNQTRRWNRASMCQLRIGYFLAAQGRKNGKTRGFVNRIRENKIKTSNQKNEICA